MPKKPKITQQDIDTFNHAVSGTRPLRTTRKERLMTPHTTRRTTNRSSLNQSKNEPLDLNESSYVEPVGGEEYISFKQPSVSHKILRKLKKGQYTVGAVLDLHGMSIEEARLAVSDFLQECLRQEIRVVHIIHGKGHHSGTPTLKNKLNHWLRRLPIVLAFSAAPPAQGGGGAISILLKHSKESID